MLKLSFANYFYRSAPLISYLYFAYTHNNLIEKFYLDSPEPWGIGFQDGVSPGYTGIVELHDNIFFYLVVIAILVFWMLGSTIYYFNYDKTKITHKYLVHGTLIEILWTIFPAIVLLAIAIPSFRLLYILDEVTLPTITVKVTGHQWYWSAPFNLIHRRNYNFAYPTVMDSKEIGLSDFRSKGSVKRLGECSMPIKVEWSNNVLGKNLGRSITVMVLSIKSFRANTALAIKNISKSYSDINPKFQLGSITVSEESLQQEGQEILPKTANSGELKNWGFPKGYKSHCYSQDGRWTNKVHGNGVSVVWGLGRPFTRIGDMTSKGKQLTGFLYLLAGNKVNYTSSSYKNANLESDREIRCTYNQLFDIELYKTAYTKLKSNPGNMTPGADEFTLDGVSKGWAINVIQRLKDRSFQFKPSLRVYIPKANSKLRPLGIPSPRDKIIQQAIRMVLESKFEPLFLNTSHGFRPKRSTHSAIFEVRKWNGITWMIEGDIKGYFDNIDHKILEELIKREVKDQNLIDLYWKLVSAGYVNDGNFVKNNLGVPQGGVLSPLLSNIYLHEFDKYMQTLQNKYTDFTKRVSKPNLEYNRLRSQLKKLRSKEVEDKIQWNEEIKTLTHKLKFTPSVIRDDSTGTRLYYNRYADDWLVGISGSEDFAKQIKNDISNFLNNKLNLTLSEEKTKITHIADNKVQYLGFQISRRSRIYTESQLSLVESTGIIRRPSYATIVIEAPIEKLINKLVNHGFATLSTTPNNDTIIGKVKPKSVTKWIFMKPQEILLRYNAIMRGIFNYYYPVENRNQFSYLLWIFKFSAAFTFSRKWNISPKKVWKKLGNPLSVVFKGKKETKIISLYEPETLERDRTFKLQNYQNFDPFSVKYFAVRSHHIWDEDCIICGATDNIVRHHVRHIRKGKGAGVIQIMRQVNRKQIAVCHNCHNKIHAGQFDGTSL